MIKKAKSKKSFLKNAIWLVSVCVFILAVINVNNIRSIEDTYGYFKSLSDKVWDCGAGSLEWNCKTVIPSPSPNIPDNNSSSTDNDNNTASTIDTYKSNLNNIAISEPNKVDYKRSEWKHWVGSPCDTRETVLINQGSQVTKDEKTCKVLSGSWVDVYSGETITDARDLDIDHVIPLAYAARHNGQDWDNATKEAFANDVSQLLAVSAKENRSKSDKGPSDYMPSNKEYACEYSKMWVDTATKYNISITEKDKKVLEKNLDKC